MGDKLVYSYVDKTGLPFYIGKGNQERAINLHNRSEKFKEIFGKNNCAKVFIIASNVYDEFAEDIETLCIWFMLKNRWKICNSAKTVIDEKRYLEFVDEYPEIMDALKQFNNECMEKLLGDGFIDNDICISNLSTDRRYHSKNIWEIDGVIKTAQDWCKEYGVNLSRTLQRISRHHMTPKEALIFPVATSRKGNVTAMEYWKSKGLYPNTDTTSRVICYNYNHEHYLDLDTLLSDDK